MARFDNNGLTLLEVLICIIILAVGILGLAPLVVLSSSENIISSDVSASSNLAKEKLEYFENLDSLPPLPFVEEEPNLDSVYFRRSVLTDNTTDSLVPPGMVSVYISISWTDKMERTRSSSFTTLIRGS